MRTASELKRITEEAKNKFSITSFYNSHKEELDKIDRILVESAQRGCTGAQVPVFINYKHLIDEYKNYFLLLGFKVKFENKSDSAFKPTYQCILIEWA